MFHIGQKVVCVNAKPKVGAYLYTPPPLIEGKTYTILNINSCCHTLLDVGIVSEPSFCACAYCGKIISAGCVHWCAGERFVPLEDYEAMNKLIKEITQPELVEA